MRFLYVVHIVAGAVGLLSGYLALFVRKGGDVHRRSGKVFVYVMLAMATAGSLIAALRGVAPAINIPAALLTAYLVGTAFLTVRKPGIESRAVHSGATVVALGVGLTSLAFGFQAVVNGGTRDGMPAFPFFMFGIVGLLGALGDMRLLSTGPLQGTARLARHLWRMCFALFIAALSFFIGQAQVIPKPIRIYPLLAVPVVIVFVTMLYWLWRVRVRRRLQGIVGANVRERAA